MPIFVSLLLLNEAVSSGAPFSGALAEFSNIETNIEQKILLFYLLINKK